MTLHDPGPDAPTALRGTLAIAALEADGWSLSARATLRPGRRHRAVGRLRRRRATGRGRGRRRPSRRSGGPHGAAVAATTQLAPGRAAIGPVRARLGPADRRVRGRAGAGGSATRAPGAERATGPGTSRTTPWRKPRPGAAPSKPGRPRSWTTRPAPTGTRWPCSTSCTSSSMAARSGRPARSAGRNPRPEDAGRFGLLECLDYPFYDTVDVDFYASFALLELYPELEFRGIRDLLAAVPADDPRVARSRRPGCRHHARSAGPCPTTSAARPTTRSTGPTGTASRT